MTTSQPLVWLEAMFTFTTSARVLPLVSTLDVLAVEDQVGESFVGWRHIALAEDGEMVIATVDIDPPGSSKTTVYDLRSHRLVWEHSHQITEISPSV